MKKAKHQDLADTWRKRDSKTALLPVVICCRSFPSQSVLRMLDASSMEEQERQQHRPLWKLHKEHSVWLSKLNLKRMYVDEVIDHHYMPRHPKDVSSITGRNILWRVETQLMESMVSSDFYNYIHVIHVSQA